MLKLISFNAVWKSIIAQFPKLEYRWELETCRENNLNNWKDLRKHNILMCTRNRSQVYSNESMSGPILSETLAVPSAVYFLPTLFRAVQFSLFCLSKPANKNRREHSELGGTNEKNNSDVSSRYLPSFQHLHQRAKQSNYSSHGATKRRRILRFNLQTALSLLIRCCSVDELQRLRRSRSKRPLVNSLAKGARAVYPVNDTSNYHVAATAAATVAISSKTTRTRSSEKGCVL